jgi:hypothetical protein
LWDIFDGISSVVVSLFSSRQLILVISTQHATIFLLAAQEGSFFHVYLCT